LTILTLILFYLFSSPDDRNKSSASDQSIVR